MPDTGTLLLTIGRQTAARTIMPETGLDDFVGFYLRFVGTGGNTDFSERWTSVGGAVTLHAGIWDLYVYAFLDANVFQDADGLDNPREAAAAMSGRMPIEVLPGTTTSRSITLHPIGNGGYGTFSWNITFSNYVTIYSARMDITGIGHSFSYYYYFHSAGSATSLELPAGRYRVVFTLENDLGETAMPSRILHIYQNMESRFSQAFYALDFYTPLLRYILNTWDGNQWDLAGDDITERYFAVLGIKGVYASNFDAMVLWFNELSSPALATIPENLEELKILVDAALIGIASEDAAFLDADNYETRAEAETAIVARALNDSGVTFQWIDDNRVTARINAPLYAVDFTFVLTGIVSITGIPQVGQTLTANTTTLGVSDSRPIAFQWYRGTAPITDATGNTYAVQLADIGHTIIVRVSRVGNFGGSVTSEPTAEVTDLPALTGTVSIIGNAVVGETLTADTSALDGTGAISYQWNRGSTPIPGATSGTYVVQDADVGNAITVTVTRAGNSANVTSEPTAVVILPPLEGTVLITGTPQIGQTLTADTSALGGTGVISYQWNRGSTPILDATSGTYDVQDADAGYAITVTVTRAGNSASVTSEPVNVELSADREITGFAITSPVTAEGTIVENAITVTVPFGTLLNNMDASIVHTGYSVAHEAGATQTGSPATFSGINFSTLQTFTVTADNGETRDFTVTVNVMPPSTTNSIISFAITSPVMAEGVINEATRTITVTVPFGTAIGTMRVEIEHTGQSIVGLFNPVQVQPSPPGPPIAIFANVNFSLPGPVGFRVTPETGSSVDYNVILTVAPQYMDYGDLRFANGTITYRPNHWLNTPYLAIPSSINGQPVTAIGDGAFYPGQVIYSVSIPGSVISIGSGAFRASSLETVTLNEGLQTIGAEAFANNTNLNSITIPASVTTIGLNAFTGANLTQITILSSIPNIESGGTTVVWDEFIAFFTNPSGNDRVPGTFFHDGFNWSTTP